MSELREYTLFLHWNQGDTFRRLLDENDYNISAALRDWAAEFKNNQDTCLYLADKMEDVDLTAFSDEHHISFEPGDDYAQGLLEVLVKENVLNAYDLEDDFSYSHAQGDGVDDFEEEEITKDYFNDGDPGDCE